MALNHPKNRNLHWKSYATVAQKPVKKLGQLESMPFFFSCAFPKPEFQSARGKFSAFLLVLCHSETQLLFSHHIVHLFPWFKSQT